MTRTEDAAGAASGAGCCSTGRRSRSSPSSPPSSSVPISSRAWRATRRTGQAAWGYGIAAAGFVIAILSPVLGSIADQTGPRKPWIGFFAAIKIVSLCLLWFAAPGSSLFLVVAVLLAGLGRGGILDRLQRFDDAAPGLQGRDRPDLQHRLGARLSRRHDRADLRRRLHGRLAGDRQDDHRPRSALRPRPEARRGRARHRAAVGDLVFHLHPADVLLHAGRQRRACRSGRRCARAWPN